jgi:hypothetical protein
MRLGASILLAGVVGCSPAAPPNNAVLSEHSAPIEFAFGVLDGSVVTHQSTHGRVTVLLFVTSFDLPSQVAARRVADLQRTHRPRFNATAIALESAENATLVGVFRDTLSLPYPVAIADRVELQSSPAFSRIDRVPTLVLLDREGRITHQHYGAFDPSLLEAWLRAAER